MGAPMKSYSKKSSTLRAALEHSIESDWNIRRCFAGAMSSHIHFFVRKLETLSEFVNNTVRGMMRMDIIPERRCRWRAAEVEKIPTFSWEV